MNDHKNNAWISVAERLPEEHEAVLVWHGRINIAFLDVAYALMSVRHAWVAVHDNRRVHGITHWQPLPDKP